LAGNYTAAKEQREGMFTLAQKWGRPYLDFYGLLNPKANATNLGYYAYPDSPGDPHLSAKGNSIAGQLAASWLGLTFEDNQRYGYTNNTANGGTTDLSFTNGYAKLAGGNSFSGAQTIHGLLTVSNTVLSTGASAGLGYKMFNDLANQTTIYGGVGAPLLAVNSGYSWKTFFGITNDVSELGLFADASLGTVTIGKHSPFAFYGNLGGGTNVNLSTAKGKLPVASLPMMCVLADTNVLYFTGNAGRYIWSGSQYTNTASAWKITNSGGIWLANDTGDVTRFTNGMLYGIWMSSAIGGTNQQVSAFAQPMVYATSNLVCDGNLTLLGGTLNGGGVGLLTNFNWLYATGMVQCAENQGAKYFKSGTLDANSTGPAFANTKAYTGAGAAENGHGFCDNASFQRNSKAYASFDAFATMTTATAQDHMMGFQARNTYSAPSSAGTLNNYYSFASLPTEAGGGTVTTLYHYYAQQFNGAATNKNVYGFYYSGETNTPTVSYWGLWIGGGSNYLAGNTVIGSTITVTNGIRAAILTTAPTVAAIGTNNITTWWSNTTANASGAVKWDSYYDAASNLVSHYNFTMP
jgi:hypothetical protein